MTLEEEKILKPQCCTLLDQNSNSNDNSDNSNTVNNHDENIGSNELASNVEFVDLLKLVSSSTFIKNQKRFKKHPLSFQEKRIIKCVESSIIQKNIQLIDDPLLSKDSLITIKSPPQTKKDSFLPSHAQMKLNVFEKTVKLDLVDTMDVAAHEQKNLITPEPIFQSDFFRKRKLI